MKYGLYVAKVVPLCLIWDELSNGITSRNTYIISQVSDQSSDTENEGATSFGMEGVFNSAGSIFPCICI
jgi:hypothetical protein